MKSFSKFFESNTEDLGLIKFDREYVTPLNSDECYVNFLSDEMDINCTISTVYWGIVIEEEKNIGIWNLKIVVKSITCDLTIEKYNNEGDPMGDVESESLIIESKDIKSDIDFSDRSDYSKFHIFPSDLDIDYKNKKCTINFK